MYVAKCQRAGSIHRLDLLFSTLSRYSSVSLSRMSYFALFLFDEALVTCIKYPLTAPMYHCSRTPCASKSSFVLAHFFHQFQCWFQNQSLRPVSTSFHQFTHHDPSQVVPLSWPKTLLVVLCYLGSSYSESIPIPRQVPSYSASIEERVALYAWSFGLTRRLF
ncbi:hypothetical protein BGW80DRAFT_169489 [Lactifluus volemus]|nr:hypothetical protein BGW80DRAFT_169489 [Lactifluus volemus]